MPSRHTKERLFEVMNKINPDFKLNEISYDDAKAGEQDYLKRIKDVLSDFDNQTVDIHHYDNIVPGLTDVITNINTYDQENPYKISVHLNVRERGQQVIAITLYENISLDNAVWQYGRETTLDAPVLDELVKFVKIAAPYQD